MVVPICTIKNGLITVSSRTSLDASTSQSAQLGPPESWFTGILVMKLMTSSMIAPLFVLTLMFAYGVVADQPLYHACRPAHEINQCLINMDPGPGEHSTTFISPFLYGRSLLGSAHARDQHIVPVLVPLEAPVDRHVGHHAHDYIQLQFRNHGPLVDRILRLRLAHVHVLLNGGAPPRVQPSGLAQPRVRFQYVFGGHLGEQAHTDDHELAPELDMERHHLPKPLRDTKKMLPSIMRQRDVPSMENFTKGARRVAQSRRRLSRQGGGTSEEALGHRQVDVNEREGAHVDAGDRGLEHAHLREIAQHRKCHGELPRLLGRDRPRLTARTITRPGAREDVGGQPHLRMLQHVHDPDHVRNQLQGHEDHQTHPHARLHPRDRGLVDSKSVCVTMGTTSSVLANSSTKLKLQPPIDWRK
ncbi:hypothetical protein BKA63DRAFT_587573 [Paraphoma chrysanthemicola]|nr:hypothetical protein BKA63DRAFT_587573 [Paraphoma chrysanthemicola]